MTNQETAVSDAEGQDQGSGNIKSREELTKLEDI